MIDIITLIGIVLGIILIKFASKKQSKILRNMGVFVILICLIYVIPSFLKGVVEGFVDGVHSSQFY